MSEPLPYFWVWQQGQPVRYVPARDEAFAAYMYIAEHGGLASERTFVAGAGVPKVFTATMEPA